MRKLTKDRINVNSQAIKLAEYNYKTKRLKLTFRGKHWTENRKYIYIDVEPFIFEGLRNAESIGKFVNKHIKPLTFERL